jgi:hypothetical protein
MRNRQLREKLEKEFSNQTKSSDIKVFEKQFDDLQRLWGIHLTTSKEEDDSIKAQTRDLKIRTETLEKQVTNKKDDLDKRTENHKEISSNKLKEIQALSDAHGKSISDKKD